MRTILVTGGCGFIGSHFIRYLLETYPGERVVNVDKLTYAGNPANLRDVEERFADRYRFVEGDIADREAVFRIFAEERPSFVANLAAESHVDRSIHEPRLFLETNVIGASVIFDAARAYGAERVLHVSTDEVYGVAEGDREFREGDALAPKSPYAASKAAGDLLAFAYFGTYGLPVVVTRGSNAYGPNQYPEKFIPLAITNLIEGKKVPLYPPGTQVREWTHVLDHVRALDCVMRKGKVGEAYNFGSGERRENIEVVRAILAAFGRGEEWITFVDARPGHDARYALASEKIRELGWEPQETFADGLRETIEWYEEHEEWWKPLKESGSYQSYAEQHYGKTRTSH
jgi:dTDP-glucose 4,6-dehydratase